MSKTIFIGGRLESKEKGNVVAGANAILDDTKGKKQDVINKETDDELLRLEQSKQDNLTFDNAPIEDSTNPVTSGGVYTAEKALSDAIEAILLLIPSAATALNKLVDTNTMNSSISTATATFRGTYNAVSDLGLTYQATHAQIEAALDALGLTADNNDYAFVQVPVSDQSQDIAKTERYKNNGTNWQYEYDLNTSGFTAAQWAAINSTITLALVQKLAALPTNAELLQALGLKQDVLTFDNAPTTDSNNPVKSGGIKEAIDTAVGDEATARENADLALAGLIGDEQTRAEGVEGGLNTRLGAVEGSVTTIQGVIPSEATSSNKLVDYSSMTTYIGTIIDNIDATFNVTSTDGHVTLAITQVNGVITSVQLATSDIASAAALNLKASQADLTALAGRVTTAEGNITSLTGRMTTAESDIDTLTDLYNALQQSAPQVIQPTDTWPVANPSTTVIYRVIDRVNTPPEYYSDYMWNGTSMVLMATYNNAVDTTPKKDSANLITSGGVFANIGAFDISEYHKSGSTLATYADLTAALAALPSDYQKGGMSIKFVQSSDNKYVQYRLMSQSFTTDVTQWQSVDDVRMEMDKLCLETTKLVIQGVTASQIIEFPYNVKAISNEQTLIQVDSDYIDNNPIYLYENSTSGTYHAIRNHQSYKITFGSVTKLILYIPNISQISGEGDVFIKMQFPNNISLKLDGLAGDFNTITGSGQYIQLATNISKDSFFAVKLNSSGTFPVDIWAEYSDSTYKRVVTLTSDDVNNIRIFDVKNDINTLYINNNVTNINIEFGECDNSDILVAAVEDTRKLLDNFSGNSENVNVTTRGLLVQDKEWMKQNMRVKFTLLACNSNNISIQVYVRKEGSLEDILSGNFTEIGGTFYTDYTDSLSQVYFYSNYSDATEYTIRVDWVVYNSFNSDLYNRIYSPKLLSSKIFARVGCIGDSYTSGHIDISGTPSVSNPQFAWPKFMEYITGRIYTNFGVSGSTAKQWVEGQANLAQVQAEGNKCQAYMIGLMLNDVSTSNPYYTPVGTVSDIGTNADTYYAYYYRLIQLVLQVNPSAKIFCMTCPAFDKNYSYNQAIRDIVAYCNNNNQNNVILCDLASDIYNNLYFFKNSDFLKDKVNGHFTAIGYEYMAECLSLILSDVIISNEILFRDVYSIPYDTV